jgi:oligo-alginate lyase
MRRAAFVIAAVLGVPLTAGLAPAADAGPTKSGSTFYGPARRANAAANAARYAWAREQVAQAVATAQPWVETPDEQLWSLIIPPMLKRSVMVNLNKGCPTCGMAMYGQRGPNPYAWIAWVPGHPWKVQCPHCRELFPKNDFGAFYRSGIDPKTGLFDPRRADRKLLFNTEHPDPADPLHRLAVDDGNGWQRFPGGLRERDWYIGHHVLQGLNSRITGAIRALATAYALTGRAVYAHKCAILLDRLADVYPDYNGKAEQLYGHTASDWWDGIVGPNYWEGGSWAQRALDYDMICDGIDATPDTLAFLRAKAQQYHVPRPKQTVADIRANIEQRILVAMGRHHDRIWMNGTATEMCQAKVDLVLRGQAGLKDFVGRHMPAIVPPEHLNNDGSGNERSTGYDSGVFGEYCGLVEELWRLEPAATKAALEGYPKLRSAFDFWADVWCLEKFIPPIGDSGEPGAASGPAGTAGAYLALFDLTGDSRYAQVALRIAGEAAKLPRDIYAADPEGLVARAIQADRAAGSWHTGSVLKPDYKLCVLRAGDGEAASALWLFYSSRQGTSSHAHFDALSIGLYAFGLPMICEQGYPLYTGDWPARWQWTSHTHSHATVTIDGQCQGRYDGGRLLGFGREKHVQFVSAEAPQSYPNTALYRRTLVSVELGSGRQLILDVFRVLGGREHHYTVPVFYADLTVGGLDLAPHANLYDRYIEKVTAGPALRPWWVDYSIRTGAAGVPAAHLRVHGPASDATVLLGDGETRLGHDQPQRLPYLVLQRQASQGPLDSTFVLVYEPYKDTPYLKAGSLRANVGPHSARAELTTTDDHQQVLTVEESDARVTVRWETDRGQEAVILPK